MNHAVNWRDPNAESSDLMGSGDGILNAPHVVEMGWLKAFAGKVVEVDRGGELTVEPLEVDPRRSAMAKVAVVRPSAEGNVYYLSYRAPRPGDTLAPEFTQGLTIHTGDPSRRGGALTPAGPPPAPAGTVQSLGSGKCLDLPGGRGDDGTSPIQYRCHGRQNQQWSVEGGAGSGYRIVSKLSGKCLALGVASGPSGKSIVETPCGSSPTELWDLHATRGGSTVQSCGTSLCLDVPGRSATNGARPIVWPCNGGINQAWRVETSRPR